MKIVRDVLDAQLLDRRDQPMGKVDGIVAELRPGEPPRLVYLEVSGPTLARRLHPRLGRWAQRVARRFSPTRGQPYRIPWSRIHEMGTSIRLDVDADRTRARAWEHWLRDHVIRRIPGA